MLRVLFFFLASILVCTPGYPQIVDQTIDKCRTVELPPNLGFPELNECLQLFLAPPEVAKQKPNANMQHLSIRQRMEQAMETRKINQLSPSKRFVEAISASLHFDLGLIPEWVAEASQSDFEDLLNDKVGFKRYPLTPDVPTAYDRERQIFKINALLLKLTSMTQDSIEALPTDLLTRLYELLHSDRYDPRGRSSKDSLNLNARKQILSALAKQINDENHRIVRRLVALELLSNDIFPEGDYSDQIMLTFLDPDGFRKLIDIASAIGVGNVPSLFVNLKLLELLKFAGRNLDFGVSARDFVQLFIALNFTHTCYYEPVYLTDVGVSSLARVVKKHPEILDDPDLNSYLLRNEDVLEMLEDRLKL